MCLLNLPFYLFAKSIFISLNVLMQFLKMIITPIQIILQNPCTLQLQKEILCNFEKTSQTKSQAQLVIAHVSTCAKVRKVVGKTLGGEHCQNHNLHMFRFMIKFISCLMGWKANGWGSLITKTQGLGQGNNLVWPCIWKFPPTASLTLHVLTSSLCTPYQSI